MEPAAKRKEPCVPAVPRDGRHAGFSRRWISSQGSRALQAVARLDRDLPDTAAAPNLPRHTSRRKTHLNKFVRHNEPRLRPGTDKRTAARGRPIPYPTLSYLVPGAPSCLAGRCAQGLRPGSSEIFRARSQAPLSRPEILSPTALRVALRGLMPGMLRLSGTR